jgi:aminoglycoside phosphotransferase (APT) family kinase protein
VSSGPDERLRQALEAVLSQRFGGPVVVEHLVRMAGGSSSETFSFEAAWPGGRRRLVLRRALGGGFADLAREVALFEAARQVGVPVPEVLASSLKGHPARAGAAGAPPHEVRKAGPALEGHSPRADPAGAVLRQTPASDAPSTNRDEAQPRPSDHVEVDTGPFVVLEHVAGEALPRRVLRAPELEAARSKLVEQAARALAAIHRIPVAAVPSVRGGDQLGALRALLDRLGAANPVLEVGLRVLEATRPPTGEQVVVHGDFRLGNLLVGPDGLRAVLDWEIAHLGDPLEDLAWACAKPWRFGSALPALGLAPRETLVEAYEAASGRRVDRRALGWWEVFALVRWGVVCLLQWHRHHSGAARSVELAAIGRRLAEVEWDLLDAIGVGRPSGCEPGEAPRSGSSVAPERRSHPSPPSEAASPVPPGVAPEADVAAAERRGFLPWEEPSARELLEALAEFLDQDLASSLEGRTRFHALVGANVARMVAREIALGELTEARQRARLGQLGVASMAELAQRIRSASMRMDPALLGTLRDMVADRLAVANPGYVDTGPPETLVVPPVLAV